MKRKLFMMTSSIVILINHQAGNGLVVFLSPERKVTVMQSGLMRVILTVLACTAGYAYIGMITAWLITHW